MASQTIAILYKGKIMEAQYYECHITIEPVEGDRLTSFSDHCKDYGFKVATLLMQKSLQRSTLDSFTTGKDKDYYHLKDRMYDLIAVLRKSNFDIRRYKIEAIILDSKL
jgi:hypothetical protein